MAAASARFGSIGRGGKRSAAGKTHTEEDGEAAEMESNEGNCQKGGGTGSAVPRRMSAMRQNG